MGATKSPQIILVKCRLLRNVLSAELCKFHDQLFLNKNIFRTIFFCNIIIFVQLPTLILLSEQAQKNIVVKMKAKSHVNQVNSKVTCIT